MSRPFGELTDGINQSVRHEPRGFAGQKVNYTTMALTLVGGGFDSWLIRVYADCGRGCSLMGAIRTLPWGSGDRTVLYAAHPGANAWEVTGRRIRPVATWDTQTPGDPAALSNIDRIGVNMSGTPLVGGPWGITVVRGMAEIAQTPHSKTGVSGAFTLRGQVLGWSARNDNGVDGSVTIDNEAPIVVPAGGGFVRGPEVPYLGYANYFNFAGTSEYLVEYLTENLFEGAGG